MNSKLYILSILLLALPARANNLRISNARLGDQDTGAKTREIEFDISWENSWRDDENHDAVWVFLKYTLNGADWRHGTLQASGTDPAGFDPGTGTALEIVVPADKKGAFIRRVSPGAGNVAAGDVAATNILFVWDYGADLGGDNGLAAVVCVRVMGIEMVYVAEGEFWLGDHPSSPVGTFTRFTDSPYVYPFKVTSEDELGLGGGIAGNMGNSDTTGMLSAGVDDFDDSTIRTLPAAFPKGYNAFYCMKYPVTQGQYADFLNTLRPDQREDYAPSFRPDRRIVIEGKDCGEYLALAPDRVCSYMSIDRCEAYADWSALRPMTEMEYEKACRGPEEPVRAEFAWGTTTIVLQEGHDGEDGSGTETAFPANANATYAGDYFLDLVRVGIYATATSTREQAGASYWGIMHLSGNLMERPVTVGSVTGRAFTGAHGDGELGATANATIPCWPGRPGTGFRGDRTGDGYTSRESSMVTVSSRFRASQDTTLYGRNTGWRGVRTCPEY